MIFSALSYAKDTEELFSSVSLLCPEKEGKWDEKTENFPGFVILTYIFFYKAEKVGRLSSCGGEKSVLYLHCVSFLIFQRRSSKGRGQCAVAKPAKEAEFFALWAFCAAVRFFGLPGFF